MYQFTYFRNVIKLVVKKKKKWMLLFITLLKGVDLNFRLIVRRT